MVGGWLVYNSYIKSLKSYERNICIARMLSVGLMVMMVVVIAWSLTVPVQSQVSKCCDNQEIFYPDNMTCGHTEVNK